MANKKKHHYVPFSYLKRFSSDSKNIFVKLENGIKLIPLREQNQKDYLYSLGQRYFGNYHNLFEDFLGKNVEDPFNQAMDFALRKNEIPRDRNLLPLAYFTIIQSCRPLIYKTDFEQSFELFGINNKDNPLLNFGFLVIAMINKFWEKVKTCSVEILLTPPNRNFITSDNPSTLWIPATHGDIFIPLTLRHIYEDHPDLQLVMPLSPEYLLRIYLNKERPTSQTIWDPNPRTVSEQELDKLNARIFQTKHKKAYAYDKLELEQLY